MHAASLPRRAIGELVGTALLVTVVVGSGIMATDLTADVGLQLLANSIATAFGLAALILMIGPLSGAHFNPVVSLADWWLGRRAGRGRSHRPRHLCRCPGSSSPKWSAWSSGWPC